MTEDKVKAKIADIEKHIDRGAECATQKLFGKFIDLFKSLLDEHDDDAAGEPSPAAPAEPVTPPTETPPPAPEVPVVSDVVPPQPTSDQPK